MTPLEFLMALWENKPEQQYILIWTYPDKRSHWFTDVAAAAEFVINVNFLDVYVGVGLAPKDYGPTHRCVSEEIVGITGLWADLDLKSAAHGTKPLPARTEDALTIIPAALPPTIIIATGNGVHAWWLFKEPWVFESEEERKEATALVGRWHTLLRVNSQQKGWALDRLSDLARLLRIPGTRNLKDPANPKEVTVNSTSDRRYNPSDFLEYLDDMGIADPEAEERAAREWQERFKGKPGLVLNTDAAIPEQTLQLWMETDMRFRNTWERQRHDLHDQSQSGYDLALACFGMDAEITEQQIVDLICHHRRKHGRPQRTRIDYFQRTISKAARKTGGGAGPGLPALPEGVIAAPAPSEVAPEVGGETTHTEREATQAAEARRRALDHISAVIEAQVLRIVKVDGKDPSYRVEMATGEKIEFQNLGKLTTAASFRLAIMTATNRPVPRIKPKVWEGVEKCIMQALEVEETTEEMHWEGSTRLWLSDYLAGTGFISVVEGQSIQHVKRPMVYRDHVTINAADFQEHVNRRATCEHLSVKAIASGLRAIGARTTRVPAGRGREQKRWALPVEDFDPHYYQKHLKEAGHDSDE